MRDAQGKLRAAGIRCSASSGFGMPGLACDVDDQSVNLIFDPTLLCQRVEETDSEAVMLIAGEDWVVVGDSVLRSSANSRVAAVLGGGPDRTTGGEFCASQ